jgi:hypothetical protein
MAERKRKGLPRNRPPAEQAKAPEETDQPLSEAEKRLVAEFQKRREARHRPPRVKLVHKPPKPVTIERPADEPRFAPLARLMAFGTTSNDFYSRTFLELLEAACRGTTSKPFEEGEVNGALAAISRRSGKRCQAPAVRGWSVCRMHGARGGAPKGNSNARKHGRYAGAVVARRRELLEILRVARGTLAEIGEKTTGRSSG